MFGAVIVATSPGGFCFVFVSDCVTFDCVTFVSYYGMLDQCACCFRYSVNFIFV